MCVCVCVFFFTFVVLSAKQSALVGIMKMTVTVAVLKWTACLLRAHKPQEILWSRATPLTAVVLFHITFCF